MGLRINFTSLSGESYPEYTRNDVHYHEFKFVLPIPFCLIAGIMIACDQNITKNHGMELMQVKIISLENCSATLPTIRMVKDIAAKLGITIDFKHVVVRTPEEANEHRLIGSPTVQINGIDIEPQARDINQFGIT